MKAIILAAGRGTRLKPLSNTTPKPLIKIVGKTILEHNLEAIYAYVDEVVIIVKYLENKIKDYLGEHYKGVPITYITQGEEKGTGGALRGISLQDDVLILNGDSIFHPSDIQKIIKLDGYGVLVQEVENPQQYGIFQTDTHNHAIKVVEKPEKFIGNIANLGVYKFSPEIFTIAKQIKSSSRGEYEITDAVNTFLQSYTFITIPITKYFIDIGYTWKILEANAYFLEALTTSNIQGTIEAGVTIKGNIILEEGAIIKTGTYIEGNCYIGKNTTVGPNSYLRGNTCLGNNCHIGNAVEVKNSTFGDNSHAAHLSYIGDSVIGNNVNLGGGMMTANLRHDGKNIKVLVKNELIDTGKRKLGVIIGDNVKTGAKTMSMPGRIIENDTFTLPGEVVK